MSKQAAIQSNYYTRNLVIPFPEVKEKVAINKEQDMKIMGIFTSHPDMSFTAWEVWDVCGELGYGYLIGSVRRSVTTLKKANIIEKTGQKMEREGSTNNTWRLKK